MAATRGGARYQAVHGRDATPAPRVEMRLEPHTAGHVHLLPGFGVYPKGSRYRVPGREDSQVSELKSRKKEVIVSWI